MSTTPRTHHRLSLSTVSLALAGIATVGLLGATVSTSDGAEHSDQIQGCFGTPDAAEAWIAHGPTLQSCTQDLLP